VLSYPELLSILLLEADTDDIAASDGFLETALLTAAEGGMDGVY
jgi:hypothetical protein